MSWSLSEKPAVVKCTKALVKEFAEMEPAPNDRIVRPVILQSLKLAIENAKFRLADFASVTCSANGNVYRVNGKHTATVLAEMNGHFPKDLFAVVERYKADTMEDVASLYSTFDPAKSARRRGDINKAFAAAHPDLIEVPGRIIDACVGGIAYAKWEDSYPQHDFEECAAALLSNPQFVMATYFLLKGDSKKVRHLCRRSVVAAMFKTFGKNQKHHDEFWTMVRDESHPSNTHPTRKLSRHLLTHAIRHRDLISSDCDSWHGMYVRCLHAWNAYRTDSTTDLKYHEKKPTPAIK